MNCDEIKSFCTYFYYSTNIPIRFYNNGEMQIKHPESPINPNLFDWVYNILLNQPQSVTYLVSKQFVYYGIVKNLEDTNQSIIIGPSTHIPFSKEMIKDILVEVSVSLVHTHEATEYLNKSPLIPFDRFLHLLCFINFSINRTYLHIDEILDYKNQEILFPITVEHTSKIYKAKEDQHFHNTYQFEKQYLSIIENGDLASLKKLLEDPIVITPGVVADNGIRQVKNIFIAGTTLVTRASIKGGLDAETAYQLSDVYIQQMEKLHSIEAIYNYQYQMLFDFAERVLAAKMPAGVSLIVYECITYINSNTNQPITVEDVAESVKRSRSFISRKFKQELGFGMNEFINSRKIEEAKYLLTYSEKSISEISFYLCFSSQSYFQNVFKKKLGITPNEFRLKAMSSKNTVQY